MSRLSVRTQFLQAIGLICLLAGIIGDSFLHLPALVIFSLLGIGIVCMLLGNRAARRERRGEPPVPVDQRHKRFAILAVLLAAGFVGGYFLERHDHPEFSITLTIMICVLGFLSATGIMCWQIYRPRTPKT